MSVFVLGPLDAESVSAASAGTPSGQVLTIVQKARADAEQQIIALHGQSTFSLLKQKIAQEYPPHKVPAGKASDPCPALGFTHEDTGPVMYAKVLNQAGAYYLTGMEALLNGHPEIANWCFAVAASKMPTCSVYLSNLAFVFNEDGDFMDALVLLEYAKTLDPSDSSIYVNLAFSYQHLKKYDEAIQALLFAIALHPNFKGYQDMLLELQKMRKSEAITDAIPPVANEGEKQPKSAQLDDALKLLEEQRQKDFNEELSSGFKPSPSSGGGLKKPTSRVRRSRPAAPDRLNPKIFGDNRSECRDLSKQAYVLERAGDEWVQSAGLTPKGGNPVDKFISTAHDFADIRVKAKNLKDFAKAGSLAPALVLYGVAGDIYMECRGSDQWEDEWPEVDSLFEQARAEHEREWREFWEKLLKEEKEEKFDIPHCARGICVSSGDLGTLKLEISDSFRNLEIRVHPTNIYKFMVKMSYGPQIERKLGGVASASASINYNWTYRFGRGFSRGVEMGGALSFGEGVTRKVSKSFDPMKFMAENTPGTPKTGWKKP